jgi:hypothetical protein
MSVAQNLVLRADRRLGAAVSHAVRAHHRRRLERVGWLAALEAPAGGWAGGEPRPRPGGSLEILIDGAEALPRMVTQLERAESHVHIAGWHFSPVRAHTRRRGSDPSASSGRARRTSRGARPRLGRSAATFATLALAAGADLYWVSKQLGHANIATTLKHYARFLPAVDERNLKLLDEFAA